MYVRVYHDIAAPVRYGRDFTPRTFAQVRRVLTQAAERFVPEGSGWSFVTIKGCPLVPVKIVSDCGLAITIE